MSSNATLTLVVLGIVTGLTVVSVVGIRAVVEIVRVRAGAPKAGSQVRLPPVWNARRVSVGGSSTCPVDRRPGPCVSRPHHGLAPRGCFWPETPVGSAGQNAAHAHEEKQGAEHWKKRNDTPNRKDRGRNLPETQRTVEKRPHSHEQGYQLHVRPLVGAAGWPEASPFPAGKTDDRSRYKKDNPEMPNFSGRDLHAWVQHASPSKVRDLETAPGCWDLTYGWWKGYAGSGPAIAGK